MHLTDLNLKCFLLPARASCRFQGIQSGIDREPESQFSAQRMTWRRAALSTHPSMLILPKLTMAKCHEMSGSFDSTFDFFAVSRSQFLIKQKTTGATSGYGSSSWSTNLRPEPWKNTVFRLLSESFGFIVVRIFTASCLGDVICLHWFWSWWRDTCLSHQIMDYSFIHGSNQKTCAFYIKSPISPSFCHRVACRE